MSMKTMIVAAALVAAAGSIAMTAGAQDAKSGRAETGQNTIA